MMGSGASFDPVSSAALLYAFAVMFILVIMMPARVLQKRHGYPAWLLIFGLIPYLGPLALLWAFAVSSPKQTLEASA